eukprot:CAMPEP_0170117356 /NCGR_PEP_ID=MMETSP0020_2-20130122/12951_1 /TAXON_ID=98059 /ORGANISM="Dinobryon sp., Strain UTEXLB2267" /LENGTH=695 /DNA_ID=CAMNT_0010345919 /DNA_START=336 /DNA_END=2422 /DNA_ORIENTATION=+
MSFSFPSSNPPSKSYPFSSSIKSSMSYQFSSSIPPSNSFSFPVSNPPSKSFPFSSSIPPSMSFSFPVSNPPSKSFPFSSSIPPSMSFSFPVSNPPSKSYPFSSSISPSMSYSFSLSNAPSMSYSHTFSKSIPFSMSHLFSISMPKSVAFSSYPGLSNILSSHPTLAATKTPSNSPSIVTQPSTFPPTYLPLSSYPTFQPSTSSTNRITSMIYPTEAPTLLSSSTPSIAASSITETPSCSPESKAPTVRLQSIAPTAVPSAGSSIVPTNGPSVAPTPGPTKSPQYATPTSKPQYAPTAAPFIVDDVFLSSTTNIAVKQSTPHVDSSSVAAIEDTVSTTYGVYGDPGAIVRVNSYTVSNATSTRRLLTKIEPVYRGYFNLPPHISELRSLATSPVYSVSFSVLVVILKSSAAANGTSPEKLAQSQQLQLLQAYQSGNLTANIRKFALILGSTALQNTTVQAVVVVVSSVAPSRSPTNPPIHYDIHSGDNGLSDGAIAGIVIGGVCAVFFSRRISEQAAAGIAHPKYSPNYEEGIMSMSDITFDVDSRSIELPVVPESSVVPESPPGLLAVNQASQSQDSVSSSVVVKYNNVLEEYADSLIRSSDGVINRQDSNFSYSDMSPRLPGRESVGFAGLNPITEPNEGEVGVGTNNNAEDNTNRLSTIVEEPALMRNDSERTQQEISPPKLMYHTDSREVFY